MSVIDPIETIAEVIGGRDYDYEQRDQARRVVIAIRTGLELRRALWLALTADNPLSRLTRAPSSPVETMDAPEQRPDHTSVIRPADEAERTNTYLHAISRLAPPGKPGHWVKFSTRRAIASVCMALADAEHAALTAEVAELKADHSATFREGMLGIREGTASVLHVMAERNKALAEVERLRAQLNEATTVPDDPTTSQESTAPRLVVGHGAVGNTPLCRVHPEHFMPCSRCLGYGCTACDNAALQAADDRRAL